MADTALNFGPDWLRALAHGSNSPGSAPASASASSHPAPPNTTTIPKYSLAKYRYGREEMLALIPKDPERPDCLSKDTSKVVRDSFILPLALTPATEDEQRLWSRSVNSEAVLRASGKSVPGNMGRSGRGGSVDRGRGRGRGGYYQRGIASSYDQESEDGPPFSRPKPIERSQSANEKDQRWDDRDRRFDRNYSGRGSGVDDNMPKLEQSRNSHSQEYWRKHDKDDESDWRSVSRSDKMGSRGSWRNPVDKERRDIERNPSSRSLNGNSRGSLSHQKVPGNHLPEWSMEEANEQDVVGTFDSSGAFLETKVTNENSDDIYLSDDADEGVTEDSPEAKRDNSSRKTPQKASSPQVSTSSKLSTAKQTSSHRKAEEPPAEKHPPKHSEPPSVKPVSNSAANNAASHVIKNNSSVEHHIVHSKKPDYTPITMPNVPDNTAKSMQGKYVISNQKETGSKSSLPSTTVEEDAFAHHKKATENMVAQWTEEEEQRVISQSAPPVQETDVKWFYQDPQGQIQGPFKSSEMLEWFTAGYFTMSLMVRRNCDESFSQLGDLIKSWGRVPFLPSSSPPPVRVAPMTTSLPTPPTQTIVPNPVTAPTASQLPKQDEQFLALQQQLLQHQLMQQQILLRQAQLQQLLSQLKQQENFTSLNTQQQQQVLQQFMAQQQLPRPNLPGVSDQSNPLDTMTPLPLPLLGLPMAPLLKNDLSLWNMTPTATPWPMNVPATQPSAVSIWDIEPPKPAPSDNELEKKRLAEEQEKQRKAEEERLAQEKEIEEKRKIEELKRKQEEERLLQELKKQEEEKKRLEELKRQEEEIRRQEELKRLEELRQKEEEKRKKEEELRRIEEQKRLEELKRQEEKKRLEELKRIEEERRQEEARNQMEKELEEKQQKEELQKKLEMEQERERIELEKQKMAARLKELEREQQIQRERQKQKEKEEEMRRLAEIKLKAQGPAWGIQNSQSETQLSLADIQRLQEEKEKQEREEREKVRQQQLQQQAARQAQQNKNGLSWAKSFYKSAETQPVVKSLVEIQLEEAERLVQQQKSQKPQTPTPVVNSNVGVWGNASHLNRITAAPPSWNTNSVATTGFWDDALSSTQVRKQPAKSNDSAFPALSNHPEKPASASVQSNKSKNVRAKKEEDAVKKLFGNHKPTDEFTAWCTEALSAMPSSVDVPTFVAFLKDIESPYEVHDYVKSYLGDGKEPREFAKQFLEKRSKFRAKQASTEDNSLWGPAPAINPVVNKTNSQPGNDNDGNSNSKGKTRRRKNRMQRLDSSMLGFTVQSNPDRLNVGEIEHIDM